jgi:peptidoglycan/xylan/chitin deacetylase (PgdA/CDA1 family)
MVGEEVEPRPDIALQVHEAGHVVGNHSHTHPHLLARH